MEIRKWGGIVENKTTYRSCAAFRRSWYGNVNKETLDCTGRPKDGFNKITRRLQTTQTIFACDVRSRDRPRTTSRERDYRDIRTSRLSYGQPLRSRGTTHRTIYTHRTYTYVCIHTCMYDVCEDRNLANSIFDAVNMRGMYPTRARDSRFAHFYYSTMAEFASVAANRCGNRTDLCGKNSKTVATCVNIPS